MSFNSLNKDELTEVAAFFQREVEPADEDNGPTKKELIAALAEGEQPVTWEEYKTIYLDAKKNDAVVADEVKELPDLAEVEEEAEKEEEKDERDKVLVRMTKNAPTYQIDEHVFTKRHPFANVSADQAEYILRNEEGFRQATAQELAEYYN